MAIIAGPDGIPAKVSALGALLTTVGDDGYPTFFSKIWIPRLTSSLATGTVLWALRAPVTKKLSIIDGQLILNLDTSLATPGPVGGDFVRFSGADPTSGTQFTPTKKRSDDPDPDTYSIRSATATGGLLTTGTSIDPTTQSFAQVSIPGIAGAQAILNFNSWAGLELGPGDGILFTARPTAAPIGLSMSGWIQFSEIS